MKKLYPYFFLLLLFALVACSKEDIRPHHNPLPNPLDDKVAPLISIETPAANDSFLVIEMIKLKGKITDDTRLVYVRVLSEVLGGEMLVLLEQKISQSSHYRQFPVFTVLRSSKNEAAVNHKVTFEARDMADNLTSQSVNLIVHAPSISMAELVNPLADGLLTKFSSVYDWSGYNAQNGISFDESWLSYSLFLMASTDREYEVSEVEWNRFTADFGINDQSFGNWDSDGNGVIGDEEFHEGIVSLNLFNDWDINKNKLISNVELARGFFNSWDHNKDRSFSKEEYLDRFFYYLISDNK